jgi:sugar phosphate isomerase/epimerase
MISISTFKAFPDLPKIGVKNGIKLELNKLVEPIKYSDELINEISESEYATYYNSAHGPFYDLIPSSNDYEIRELCKKKFIRAINACDKLHIKNIIFHTGWIKDFYPDAIWIKNSIDFWNSIISYCNDDMIIHIENVFEPKYELINEVVTGVNKHNFKVCLDIGHLNLVDSNNIVNWICKLKDNIGHLHIHNNYGVVDNHNGLDQGTIDIKKVLTTIADNCPLANWNLEIRTNFEE